MMLGDLPYAVRTAFHLTSEIAILDGQAMLMRFTRIDQLTIVSEL